jgi:hypothetical protein
MENVAMILISLTFMALSLNAGEGASVCYASESDAKRRDDHQEHAKIFEERKIAGAFSKIICALPGRVRLVSQDSFNSDTIWLKTYETLLPDIGTKVCDQELHVSCQVDIDCIKDKNFAAEIRLQPKTLAALRGLTHDGLRRFTVCSDINQEDYFTIAITNAGGLWFKNIQTPRFVLSMLGAGWCTIGSLRAQESLQLKRDGWAGKLIIKRLNTPSLKIEDDSINPVIVTSGEVETAQLKLGCGAEIRASTLLIKKSLELDMVLASELMCTYNGILKGTLRNAASFKNYGKTLIKDGVEWRIHDKARYERTWLQK